MKQWYYSDYERNRLGPVAASDLAELHRAGQLQPDTLVWQEGMANWRPWREVMQMALAEAEGRTLPSQQAAPLSAGVNPYAMAEPVAAAATPTVDATPMSAGVNPYAVAEPRPASVDAHSPYSPPRSVVNGGLNQYVTGGHVVHAGFLKRLAALFIDSLILLLLVLVMMMVAAVLGIGTGAFGNPDSMASAGLGLGFIALIYGVPIIGQFIYFTWMHASSHQATLGKMAVGIKVTDADGAQLSTGHSLGRFALRFFFYLFSCGLTDLVSAFTSGLTDRKQALHDMAAKTLVVDRWAYTAHPERQRDELGGVTVAILVLIGLVILAYIAVFVVAIGTAGMAR